MRRHALALTLAVFATGAAARTHATETGPSPADRPTCSVSTEYDVDVQPAGITFERNDGTPQKLFMHDGQLELDGQPLAIGKDDAARLRQYEAGVRALLPEVAGIARDGVGIGFDALATVAATFADDAGERHRIVARLEEQRRRALAGVDAGIGQGHWHRHSLDRLMDDGLEGAVSSLVGTVTERAVHAALSGDESQVKALQARADSLDKSIEKTVQVQADRLQARATALCPRVAELDRLQRNLSMRLPDGSALALVGYAPEHDHPRD